METVPIKRIKRCKAETVLSNKNNIYGQGNRDQLDAFVSRLFKHIETTHGVDYLALMNTYKTFFQPALKVSEQDLLELEYITIDHQEFLYHQSSKMVYSFEKIPKQIGYYDIVTQQLKLV